MNKIYGWRERKDLRLKLIGAGLLLWGIGCLITYFVRDMNWAWGCYTFELCWLWPYKGSLAVEYLGMALAMGGEMMFLAGLLMGNRGEGRPRKDYLIEGAVKIILGLVLSVPYTFIVVPGFFGAYGQGMMMLAVFLGVGFIIEAVIGVVLVVQGMRCLGRARKSPKTEKHQGQVYYRAK